MQKSDAKKKPRAEIVPFKVPGFPQQASFEIVIRKIERPFSSRLDDELNWICKSFGFFEDIDKEKTAAAVFKEIIKATEKGEALTSTALSKRVGMSRGSVINHLNNLLRSGLIIRHGRYYASRSKSMFRTIEEMEEDIERIFGRMKQTAKQIDERFGIRTQD